MSNPSLYCKHLWAIAMETWEYHIIDCRSGKYSGLNYEGLGVELNAFGKQGYAILHCDGNMVIMGRRSLEINDPVITMGRKPISAEDLAKLVGIS